MRLLLVTLALLGAAFAGCFDDDPDAPESEGDAPAPNAEPALAFADTGIGEVLVDGEGMTLYVFTNDEEGTGNCTGGCATNWPPLFGEEVPDAPTSIASLLSVIERPDGTHQIALEGRPLYYFIGDEAPGDTNGDGVNGIWFVVRPPPPNSEMLDLDGPHEVTSQEVVYFDPQYDEVSGHWASADGATVGIVVIHEWWGLNDHIRDMADTLASHGYSVLAVDLFGSVATTSEEAQAQVADMDQDEAIANMQAAAAYLRDAGAERIISLGWCFGGGQSLQLALNEPLDGTVIYYGNLVTDAEELSVIEWPVLGIFGEDDAVISTDDVRAFEAALDEHGIEHDILIYPDVGHAFANPSSASWAPEQTQDAWARTMAFLEAV